MSNVECPMSNQERMYDFEIRHSVLDIRHLFLVNPIPLQTVDAAARAIHEAFASYRDEFRAITRRARARFERREWREGQADAVERLALYRRRVEQVVTDVPGILGELFRSHDAWRQMKD